MPVRFSNNASTTTTVEEPVGSGYLEVVDISSFPQFGTYEGDWAYVSVGDDVVKVTGIGLLFNIPVLFLDVPLTQVIPAGTVAEIRATAELLGDLGGEASLTINYSYTALAEQTTFTGSDNNGLSLLYTASAIHVFMNGVLLDAGDYTATNGTSVVLAVAAEVGDTIQIISYGVVNADPIYREGTAVLSTGETGAAKFLREDGDGTSSWQAVIIPSSEGTAVLSTGETGAAKFLREDGDGTSSWQAVIIPSSEGTAVLSTAETGATKFLREDGDGTCSWQAVPAGGGIDKLTSRAGFPSALQQASASVGDTHWNTYTGEMFTWDGTDWAGASGTTYSGTSLTKSALIAKQLAGDDVTAVNTSAITNFKWLFQTANAGTGFNQDVGSWDTSSATVMDYLVGQNFTFNQNINGWDVSNVTSMHSIFKDAQAFNQPLDMWDVGKNTDFTHAFRGAVAFNQNINSWDVSNGTNFYSMFASMGAFNQPLSAWDTSSATVMSRMFNSSYAFNGSIADWDTSKVLDTSYMFAFANSFDQDISAWNIGKVTNMSYMLGSSQVTCDISQWDTSSVTNMSHALRQSVNTSDISGWDTSSVTNMSWMFYANGTFNVNLSGWNVASVTNCDSFRLSAALSCANTPPSFSAACTGC